MSLRAAVILPFAVIACTSTPEAATPTTTTTTTTAIDASVPSTTPPAAKDPNSACQTDADCISFVGATWMRGRAADCHVAGYSCQPVFGPSQPSYCVASL